MNERRSYRVTATVELHVRTFHVIKHRRCTDRTVRVGRVSHSSCARRSDNALRNIESSVGVRTPCRVFQCAPSWRIVFSFCFDDIRTQQQWLLFILFDSTAFAPVDSAKVERAHRARMRFALRSQTRSPIGGSDRHRSRWRPERTYDYALFSARLTIVLFQTVIWCHHRLNPNQIAITNGHRQQQWFIVRGLNYYPTERIEY